MAKIETNEDLKKYIFKSNTLLYKIRFHPQYGYEWKEVVLSKTGTYVFSKYGWWGHLSNQDLSTLETRIYCKANKRVKMPNPIFAKIKQMSDRFEKRKQDAALYI